VSWGTEALHVFWKGPDGNLKHMWMDYATNDWTAEIDVGIRIESAPTALYRNNGVMDIFWRGSMGTLQHIWSFDGANWSWIQDLGGTLAAGASPTVTGRRQGWIDVFWKGNDSHLKHVWMDPQSQWTLIEEDLAGNLASPPAATFWGAEQLQIFAKDGPTGQMARFAWREDSIVTLNDTDTGIVYSSGWSYSPERGLWDHGDDVHYTTTDGSYLEYTFTGTGIEYVTEREAHEGSVDIYIDGVFQGTIDCYKDMRSALQVLYSKKGMASGPHTIRVVKKDGMFMLLDALRIYR
jgi:hypothetical protein